MERITRLAARLLGAPVAVLAVRADGRLEPKAVYGLAADALRQDHLLGLEDLPAAGAQVAVDPDLRTRLGIRFCAGVPVVSSAGETVGALAVMDTRVRTLPIQALDPLADLAELAAQALFPGEGDHSRELSQFTSALRELHRLSAASYETLDDLFADYLRAGCRILRLPDGALTRIRGRYAVLHTCHASTGTLPAGLTFELEETYFGVVARDRHTLATTSAGLDPRLRRLPFYERLKLNTFIGAPIFVHDECYGVLSFSAPEERGAPFRAQEIEIIELMAKSIARSVTEDRLEGEQRRAEALEQDRNRVLEMVAQNQPLTDILAELARMVERQCPSLVCAVHLMHEDRLYCLAAPSLPESYRRHLQGLAPREIEGCSFAALTVQDTVVFEHLTPLCSRTRPEGCIHEYCWQAAGSSPIRTGSGATLGVLVAYYRLAVQPRQVDKELLRVAARLAAIAIEQKQLTEKLAYHASHDLLTALPNRSVLHARLEREIQAAEITGRRLGVVFLDLDRFKQINDRLGHTVGDALLREAARRLVHSLRKEDLVARLGGDEFTAVLTGLRGAEDALRRARRLLDVIREPFRIEGHELFVTASLGISLYPEDGLTAAELLTRADAAMYHVKHKGKNNVQCFAPGLEGASMEQLEMEHSLRRALENGEFQVSFQPQVELDGTLDGLEVLLAWDHPRLGRVPPREFIPIAEECGMIVPIGEWVLKEACRRNAAWQRAGYPPVRIAVNVSALQFARGDFVETVALALEESGLPPEFLELEITESLVLDDLAQSAGRLARLRELGVSLSIDDFGTGYSSLSYLQHLPVDTLKIDRSFVSAIDTSPQTLAVVETIITLAHNIGLLVVAEGVETERQLNVLKAIGCDKAQGHFFGEPLVAAAVERLLSGGQAMARSAGA